MLVVIIKVIRKKRCWNVVEHFQGLGRLAYRTSLKLPRPFLLSMSLYSSSSMCVFFG